ncbi:hypothetical protein PRZ48_007804 [Zasmidium cellare]|uniref:non-specific serine/threonine protein kinase n=1 Tax=Zasmidium cellare TaxID=395010 RepID=A0ABR0EL94_ZASCE|nr:hypothetical protein PRZ48_007804 [Zasmidium cellare]
MPFKRAIALTREMGYRYLWVDVLCEPTEYTQKREAIYKQAALIIVIVGFKTSPDHIWHFTCDYKNLQTVLSWAHDRIWNYTFYQVRNLGQGAYGIVDEVRLQPTQPTQQTFARKVCLSRRDGRLLQPRYLQEIEILRKFDHPNIARFVAAYVQGRSLNILMLPVAECDLRDLLARPGDWAGKLKFLPSWFLSLARAVEYMHNMSCRHKDIKPANILISGQDVLLSDFGTSQEFSTSDSGSSGPGFMTPKYCAPEVAQKQKRGRKADVFSLGCVFLEMITISFRQTLDNLKEHLGFKPNSRDVLSVYHEHIPEMRSWLKHLWGLRPLPYQERIIHITTRMLNETPSKRPTAREVRKVLLPEPLQGNVLGKNYASYHGSGATALHLASTTPSTRSCKTLTGSAGEKTMAIIKQAHSPQLHVIANIDVLLLWSSLDFGGHGGRSMVSTNTVDRLQYAAFSYMWNHETCSGSPGYSTRDQASLNLRFPAGGLSRATISTMLVINCSRTEQRADSLLTLGCASTPLVTTKTTLVILWLHDAHRSVCEGRTIAAEQSLLPQSTRNTFDFCSEYMTLPCSSDLVSACQEPRAGLSELQSTHCSRLAPMKGLKKRSALLSRLLKAIQIMLDGVLLKQTFPDHGNDPDCKDRAKQRLQRLNSVWKQICHGMPTLLTECASALFPLYSEGIDLWEMVKGHWNKLDGMFAAYERKTVLAILSQKSKVAIIIKRRFQKLTGSPIGSRGTCPQHGTVLDAPATDNGIEEDSREPLNHERTDHHRTGWVNFDAISPGSLPAPSTNGGALVHASIDRGGSWHPGAAYSCSRPRGGNSGCYESALEHGASRQLSKPSYLGAASAAFGEEESLRSMAASHAGVGSIYHGHLDSTSGFASRTDPASEHHWSNDHPSRYRHDDFADHCIEVGDLGFVPMETINRSLARHERCTCHHSELLLPSPASNVDISDIDSDTDSDTLSVCSSSQAMNNSLPSVSSCTSLSSLGHAELARPFPLLSDPLRLTTENIEFELGFIDVSEFGEFDLWTAPIKAENAQNTN